MGAVTRYSDNKFITLITESNHSTVQRTTYSVAAEPNRRLDAVAASLL